MRFPFSKFTEVILLAFFCFTPVGCQKSSENVSGTLYVINSGPNGNDGAILRYSRASAVNGNTAPDATISGVTSTLLCPYFAALDVGANRLYVADPCSAAVNIFDNVSSLNGNIAPSRRITGVLTNFAAASATAMMAVAIDTSRDILYVSTSNQALTVAQIVVFDNASTRNGDVAPDRIITTPPTAGSMLSYNHGIIVDSSTNKIYVASSGDSSVLVFEDASTLTGSSAPDQSVSGSNTGLSGAFPVGVKLDGNGNLMVSCRTTAVTPNNGGVTIFSFLNMMVPGNLNISPGRAPITGSNTTFAGPYMIDYDRSVPELYVANAYGESILVFSDFDSSVGDMTPSRALTGSSTGFDAAAGARTVTGVIVDSTR